MANIKNYKKLLEDIEETTLLNEFWDKIKDLPYIKNNIDDLEYALYRGFANYNPDVDTYKLLQMKKREKPTDTDLNLHNLVNSMFEQKFGVDVRNYLFTFNHIDPAINYTHEDSSNIYVIIPYGNYNLYSVPDLLDFTMEYNANTSALIDDAMDDIKNLIYAFYDYEYENGNLDKSYLNIMKFNTGSFIRSEFTRRFKTNNVFPSNEEIFQIIEQQVWASVVRHKPEDKNLEVFKPAFEGLMEHIKKSIGSINTKITNSINEIAKQYVPEMQQTKDIKKVGDEHTEVIVVADSYYIVNHLFYKRFLYKKFNKFPIE